MTNCNDESSKRPGITKSKTEKKLNSSAFFQKKELMPIGAYYYPEQWPKEQWGRDFKNMAAFGFEFTHFAEFSWAQLEPKEGFFDFVWLDEAIDKASKAGLKVILCTPSACPPAWMGINHPEIYLTGFDGNRKEHGLRGNASLSNEVYLMYVDKIVSAMARHYEGDKRILGWQVDNEPPAIADFSPSAKTVFHNWLKDKYKTIDKLNDSWGGSFWSTRYDNFDQVVIPDELMNNEDKLSPHAVLDFRRFTADITARFLNRQADIIRKYILPSQWITSNYTNVTIQSDPRRSDHLDFPTFTMYPINGRNELGGDNFRTGVPYKIYEACDYYRPINGVTGIMELQPGQVNWAPINPQPEPGVIHMWLMQAFAGRCSFVCTYRYRHPLFSSEMYHDGIVGTDGVTLSQGGREFVQAINDIKKLRTQYDSTAVMPETLLKIKTGILWSHDVMWDLDIQPQTTKWNTWKFRNNYTSAVKSTAAPMDFISEKDDFSKYPFLVAPAYDLIDEELVKKWQEYAENGGNLILTCRSGYKDKNGHFFESGWAGPLKKLLGSSIEYFDMLPDGSTGTVNFDNCDYKWDIWSEVLSPGEGVDVLAAYSDQFYKGKPAAITRKCGRGSVTYIGVATNDGLLERQLVREIYKRAGSKIEDLPKGIYMEWRDGFYVAVNYTDNNFDIPIPTDAAIIIGSNPVSPANAVIWKLKGK